MQGNEQRIYGLRVAEANAHNANIAIGTAGALLFWPALFALDTGNAEQVEIQALHSRNTYLATLYGERCSRPTVTAYTATPTYTAPAVPAPASAPTLLATPPAALPTYQPLGQSLERTALGGAGTNSDDLNARFLEALDNRAQQSP